MRPQRWTASDLGDEWLRRWTASVLGVVIGAASDLGDEWLRRWTASVLGVVIGAASDLGDGRPRFSAMDGLGSRRDWVARFVSGNNLGCGAKLMTLLKVCFYTKPNPQPIRFYMAETP